MSTLESELSIPPNATLPKKTSAHLILLTTQSTIPLSQVTSLRGSNTDNLISPRCLVVGRLASASDIRLDHKSISRKHAAFYFRENKICLLDLGGKKGTFVNGRRIGGEIVLSNNDKIKFGNCDDKVFQVVAERFTIDIEKTNVNDDDDEEEEMLSLSHEQHHLPTAMTREERESQIAAMMATLDAPPTYTPVSFPSDNPPSNFSEPLLDSTTTSTISSSNKISPSNFTQDLPISHSINLTTPENKQITTLSIDPAGSRILLGFLSPNICLYDFGGMNNSHTPFKTIIVEDGHFVQSSSYSPTGDKFIVTTTSAQPRVFDRDGFELMVFVKGDVYLRDMKATLGHVSTVKSSCWHPSSKEEVLTAGDDGSVRLWDLGKKAKKTFGMLCCKRVYRVKDEKGKKTAVSALAYARDGHRFVLGTKGGCVQVWNVANENRPERMVTPEYFGGRRVVDVGVTESTTVKTVLARGEDGTLRVWDLDRWKELSCWKGLDCWEEGGNAAFSPDGTMVVLGTSVDPRTSAQEEGLIKFFKISQNTTSNSNHPTLLLSLPCGKKGISVVKISWHPKLNQIFVGLSDGTTTIHYSPELSTKGALLSTSRQAKKRDALSELLSERGSSGLPLVGKIVSPVLHRQHKHNSNTAMNKKQKREETKPEPPTTSKIKVGGQSSVSRNFTQFVVEGMIGKNKCMAGKDPREELFKYSNKGGSFVDAAYKEGGKGQLAAKTAEEEEEMLRKREGKGL